MLEFAKDIKAAINKNLEDAQEDGRRAHLGASLIGKMCKRELFYGFRWAVRRKFEGRMLRLFNRGHLEEFRFEEWIKGISDNFWPLDPRTNEQIRVSDLFGYFGGSLDGVARNVAGYVGDFLVEMKTHSLKSFEKLQLSGVKESKPEHYSQMQIYLHYNPKLKGAIYFAICKNDDELYIEYVERDEAHAIEKVEVAKYIIMCTEPPEGHPKASPYNYYCKYFCDYSSVCELGGGNAAPAKSCRSCAFISLTEEGWMCKFEDRNSILTTEEQRDGCEHYTRGF